MAWNAPMTAAANTVWFASQFNKYIRDNLLETAPAKATAAGQHFVANQKKSNAILARTASQQTVTTSQTTASTSYANLSTVGPTITTATGSTAMIWFAAHMSNNTVDFQTHASVAVSGATNIPASDLWQIRIDGHPANEGGRVASFHWFHNLRAGNNTFTVKYKVGGGTGTFSNRHLAVMPLS